MKGAFKANETGLLKIICDVVGDPPQYECKVVRQELLTEPVKYIDIFEGENIMEEKESEKYLGDVISKDGRNLKNIKSRVNKGKGIVKRIVDILENMLFIPSIRNCDGLGLMELIC